MIASSQPGGTRDLMIASSQQGGTSDLMIASSRLLLRQQGGTSDFVAWWVDASVRHCYFFLKSREN
jgi:hypothetical protein